MSIATNLEACHDFAIRKGHEHMCHVGIAGWRDIATAKLITHRSVEPSCN